MNATLERISSLEAKACEDDTVGFAEIVAAIANDAAPEDDVILEVLERTGKTADNLKAAVELFGQRRQWREMVSERDIAREECTRIEGEIAVANKQFEAMRDAHLAKCDKLLVQKSQCEQKMFAGEMARRRLIETADSEIDERMEILKNKNRPLVKQLQAVNSDWMDSDAELSHLQGLMTTPRAGTNLEDVAARLQRRQATLDLICQQRESIRRQIAETQEAMRELTREKLEA